MSSDNKMPKTSPRSMDAASSSGRVTNSTVPHSPDLADTLLGTDPPIEEAHPGLQPTLVFGAYPIVLVISIAILAAYFLFFRSPLPSKDSAPVKEGSPVQVEVSK